jgi:hypothetical protein
LARPSSMSWGSRSRWRNASGSCCTTRRDKTHNTDLRDIRYPWHPWYGRHVLVIQSLTKGGQSLLRCSLDGDAVGRSQEIPAWMFDRLACCLMQLSPVPSVGADDLRRVRQLLNDAAGKTEPIIDQHASPRFQGDADAPNTPPDQARSAGSVCRPTATANLGSPPTTGEAKRPRPARRAAARPAPAAARARAPKGGRR